MSKYKHIQAHYISIENVASRMVPGGLAWHEWPALGSHYQTFLDGGSDAQQIVASRDPKRLGALLRKFYGLPDASQIQSVVIGHTVGRTPEETSLWVNVTPEQVERLLEPIFRAKAPQAKDSRRDLLVQALTTALRMGLSPDEVQDCVNLAVTKSVMES